MAFEKWNDSEVETAVREKAFEERKLTLEVIALLEEIDRRKIFLQRGYSSLMDYCVKELKYSESSAYRRIAAMRVVRDVPEVKSSVASGTLNLMNLAQAQTYFRKTKAVKAEKRILLDRLENKSSRETEKIIATLAPDILPKENLRQVTEDRSRLSLVIDDKVRANLERLKDLLSHKLPDAGFADVIEHISEMALEKLDPLRKATPAVEIADSAKNGSRYISVHAKTQVWKTSVGQCCFKDPQTGKRCASTRFLEVDHKFPYSKGGSNESTNLQLLCDAHNRWKGAK